MAIRTLSGRVAELRPAYLPPDPAGRTVYAAGEIAQCDFWFPDICLPVGFGQSRTAKLLPVLTMVLRLLPVLLGGAGAVPVGGGPVCRLVAAHRRSWGRCHGCWCGTVRARSAAGGGSRMELTQACQEFRGTLAAKVQICKPADPEAKGLVERFHDYLERSFLPGRSFASPADFNDQLCGFLARANQRRHRVLGCRPVDRLDGDRQAMLSLPAVPPVTGWRSSTRLPRDHYLRLDGNDYSVHPAAIGRRVELRADLDRVQRVVRGPACR